MYRALQRATILAAMIAGLAVQSVAATEPASVNSMLFEAPHLKGVEKGTELVYRFQRSTSEPKLTGEPFSDDIKVAITDSNAEGLKDLAVYMFTGERAREVQTDTRRLGNPIIVAYLDRAITNFAMFGGGNRPYLKQQFIKALRATAKLTPVTIDYKGKSVEGHRITLTPYYGDKHAHRMEGYENSTFTIVMSEKVPGHFVELAQVLESTKQGAPRVEERIVLSGTGGIK